MNRNVLYNLNHIQIWQTRTSMKRKVFENRTILKQKTKNLSHGLLFTSRNMRNRCDEDMLFCCSISCFVSHRGSAWLDPGVMFTFWMSEYNLCHVWKMIFFSVGTFGSLGVQLLTVGVMRLEKPPHETTNVSSISPLDRFMSLFIASLQPLLSTARGQATRRPCYRASFLNLLSEQVKWPSALLDDSVSEYTGPLPPSPTRPAKLRKARFML